MFTHIVVGKFDGIYYTCSPPHCCALLVESCPTNLSLSLSLFIFSSLFTYFSPNCTHQTHTDTRLVSLIQLWYSMFLSPLQFFPSFTYVTCYSIETHLWILLYLNGFCSDPVIMACDWFLCDVVVVGRWFHRLFSILQWFGSWLMRLAFHSLSKSSRFKLSVHFQTLFWGLCFVLFGCEGLLGMRNCRFVNEELGCGASKSAGINMVLYYDWLITLSLSMWWEAWSRGFCI